MNKSCDFETDYKKKSLLSKLQIPLTKYDQNTIAIMCYDSLLFEGLISYKTVYWDFKYRKNCAHPIMVCVLFFSLTNRLFFLK